MLHSAPLGEHRQARCRYCGERGKASLAVYRFPDKLLLFLSLSLNGFQVVLPCLSTEAEGDL